MAQDPDRRAVAEQLADELYHKVTQELLRNRRPEPPVVVKTRDLYFGPGVKYPRRSPDR